MRKKIYQEPKATGQEGNVAIEFALVAPFFLLLLFGILQAGLYIYESSTLEGALNAAAREGRTGYAGVYPSGTPQAGQTIPPDPGLSGGNRWTLVQGILDQQTGGLFNTANITFNATSYAGFQYVGLACPTYPCNGAGQSGQINNSVGDASAVVVYNVTYPSPMLPFMNVFFGVNPVITVSDIVQNEPFNSDQLVAPPPAPSPTPTPAPPSTPTPTPGSTPKPTPHATPTPAPAPTPPQCTQGCCPNC